MPPQPTPDWPHLADTISSHYLALRETTLGTLRMLLERASESIGGAEAALLLPTEDQENLRFLVSVNSTPEASEALKTVVVPCDRSIVGCVFATGQTIAIANPDDFYQEVDKKTGLSTEIYLAAPIMQEGQVLGVATFLNRPSEAAATPFGPEEIRVAERYASLSSAGLRYYQRMGLMQNLLEEDLEVALAQYADTPGGRGESILGLGGEESTTSPLAKAWMQLEQLSDSDQLLAAQLIEVLAHRELDSSEIY